MENSKSIEIQFSHKKNVLALLRCIFFVVLGCFVAMIRSFDAGILRNRTMMIALSLTSMNPVVLLGGIMALLGGVELFLLIRVWRGFSFPGLIVTEEGIIDHSGGAGNFIRWTDIAALREIKINHQKMIGFVFKDSQQHIDGERSFFEKKRMQLSFLIWGCIYLISSKSLKCSHKELMAILTEKLEAARAKDRW